MAMKNPKKTIEWEFEGDFPVGNVCFKIKYHHTGEFGSTIRLQNYIGDENSFIDLPTSIFFEIVDSLQAEGLADKKYKSKESSGKVEALPIPDIDIDEISLDENTEVEELGSFTNKENKTDNGLSSLQSGKKIATENDINLFKQQRDEARSKAPGNKKTIKRAD